MHHQAAAIAREQLALRLPESPREQQQGSQKQCAQSLYQRDFTSGIHTFTLEHTEQDSTLLLLAGLRLVPRVARPLR